MTPINAHPRAPTDQTGTHWRHTSSYHGPWLNLPPEVLESLAFSNFWSPRPRPIDPAVFFDLVKIRRLIDDATSLAVRAANGTTSAGLHTSLGAANGILNGTDAEILGIGSARGGGGGHHAKLSRERRHRMREHATQKLSHAYQLDEIAASVATMQAASAIEDVAKHVLQRNGEDADAQYVHFFHEKVPSLAMPQNTTLDPLNDVIRQKPTEASPYRTRAVAWVFKDDFLYRALIATKKIKPDPAQHRLALQLQKLYFRLKDYSPEIEYRYRLEKIGRRHRRPNPTTTTTADPGNNDGAEQRGRSPSPTTDRGILSALLPFSKSPSSTLALIRTTPLHNSALSIDSPQGMLLYGEVGRGKSMLLDLLYDSLPSRKKRRWHFNTFMLDLFRRIEMARLERIEDEGFAGFRQSLFGGKSGDQNEHVVLSLAKETISESPILFLDEFQMPDRTASKLINSFFTAFFHLGGVLVASSNRMPEELSKAAGIEFGGRHHKMGGMGFGGGFWGLGWGLSRSSEGERAAKTDFGLFLEVLKARCEVWEMEGEKDWRREEDHDNLELATTDAMEDHEMPTVEKPLLSTSTSAEGAVATQLPQESAADSPPHYHIKIPSTEEPESSSALSQFESDIHALNPSKTWHPTTLTVYARPLRLETTYNKILKASFSDLCATYLGPADYVTLCSTFHTLIITDVPVLTLAQKNEARRFITLLDALYETSSWSSDFDDSELDTDSITSESFSEIYQDSIAPFRPNVSSYTESSSNKYEEGVSVMPSPSFTPSLRNPTLRSVLADEDADFGPTYGNGRGHGISNSSTASRFGEDTSGVVSGPDFTSTSALTGEDERFAYKRARSRLWEMCGRRWWDERLPRKNAAAESEKFQNLDDDDQDGYMRWWRPVARDGRFWERFEDNNDENKINEAAYGDEEADAQSESTTRGIFSSSSTFEDIYPQSKGSSGSDPFSTSSSSSPYRNRTQESPPKFAGYHAWGMMKWGNKAGDWGKGVDADRIKKRGINKDNLNDKNNYKNSSSK
ncbi:hypothetical protein KCU88_g5236, partial [Aureobasidium melanogenum]